jgi:hypothetical protein
MKNVFLSDVIHHKEEEIFPAAQVLTHIKNEQQQPINPLAKYFSFILRGRADKTGCWRVV